MTHDIDAIYDHGVFRPVKPLVLAQGTRVHLRIEEEKRSCSAPESSARVDAPPPASPEQGANSDADVRDVPDADV